MRIIETYAEAKRIEAGEIKQRGNVIIVENEGQTCIALVPRWANWGETLEDGTRLKEGETYKITIEVLAPSEAPIGSD